MLKKSLIVCWMLLGVALQHQAFAQEPAPVINRSTTIQVVDGKEYFFHAVQRGQTLFSIARAYGVSQEDILQANPDIREFGLRFDQLIRIPVQQHAAPRPGVQTQSIEQTTFETHQVKRRETLYGISRMYGISMEQLLEHNPDARTGLRPNMLLKIPRQTLVQINFTEYRVSPGQTLFSISREFNVSIDELERLNPDLKEGLKAGQVLRIPTDQVPAQPPFLPEPITTERPQELDVLTLDPYCAQPDRKSHYNVALLIPLYLEKMEDETLSLSDPRHPSLAYLDYYHGIMIALDSIRAMGTDIRLSVFDVCESATKARTVLRKPEMATMDLIIGPFFPATLEIAAEFARVRNIPIVSPLHWEDTQLVRRFPNMFQATPSIQTQMRQMALHVARTHENDNIIVVHGNQPGVRELIAGFKKSLNDELNYRQYYRDSVNLSKIDGYYLNGVYVGERLTNVYVVDSLVAARRGGRTGAYQDALDRYMTRDNVPELVYGRDGMTALRPMLDNNRRNILVTLMGGEAIIPDYTRQLNQLRDTFDITIFGVPQWRTYRAIDFRTMQNLRVHMFASDFVDYDLRHNVDFIRRYRRETASEPTPNMAFSGVQTGMYFFSALARYGAQFWRCIPQINEAEAPSSPVWFERASGSQSGWENQHVYIIRYENFRLRNVR